MTTSKKLPVMETVRAALKDVFGDLRGFLRIIWMLWLGLAIAAAVPQLMIGKEERAQLHQVMAAIQKLQSGIGKSETAVDASNLDESSVKQMLEKAKTGPAVGLAGFLDMLVEVVLILRFQVEWYRQLLLGEKRGAPIRPGFGKAEWDLGMTMTKFSLVLFPIFLIALIVVFFETLNQNWGTTAILTMVAAAVAATVLSVRFSLAYPLTVLGHGEESLKQSWDMSRGQVLPLLLGVCMVSVPLMIGAWAVEFILSWVLLPGDDVEIYGSVAWVEVVIRSLSAGAKLFVTGVIIAFYARVYAWILHQLHGKVDQSSAPPAPPPPAPTSSSL